MRFGFYSSLGLGAMLAAEIRFAQAVDIQDDI